MQRIEDRLAAAAGLKTYEIRVTNSRQWYAFRHPDQALYISAGLLGHVEGESELAGLFAHLLAHGRGSDALGAKKGAPAAPFEQCIMARDYLPPNLARSTREAERQATQAAASYMKASRYDPEGLLDSLSKLSYQNTLWTREIASEDILRLRAALEAEGPPEDGYLMDSGDFAKLRERFSASHPLEIRFGVSSPVPPRVLMRQPNENRATTPRKNSR
jgi:hypothetical protein